MDIVTGRVRLRNWDIGDRDLFREINRDHKVMEFFPFRRTHAESDMMMDKLRDMIAATGLGFYALADAQTNEAMGFCGVAPVDLPGILPQGAYEIGWRLATRFWGNGFVTEASLAALDHAFAHHRLNEIYAFAVADNHRSTAVMQRIGMTQLSDRDFDHPAVPDTHPHLKRHLLFIACKDQT